MRIDGCWVEDDDGVARPIIEAHLRTAAGEWLACPFLVDSGAERTVISAGALRQLDQPTTPAPTQLGGVGGAVETVLVWTSIRFTTATGAPVNVNSSFAAFTDTDALELSVLGWDVLENFALILDKPGGTICLLHGRHHYAIQES